LPSKISSSSVTIRTRQSRLRLRCKGPLFGGNTALATSAHDEGLTRCEGCALGVDIFLHSGLVARGNFSRDRFAGTESVSASKWAPGVGVADLQRPVWTSHQRRRIQDPREGTSPLFEHVWKNRRCVRKYGRGGRRCRYVSAAWRQIYSRAEAADSQVRASGRALSHRRRLGGREAQLHSKFLSDWCLRSWGRGKDRPDRRGY